MLQELKETDLAQIQNSFRRCSSETVEAIVQYRSQKETALIPGIVYGIIERYVPSQSDVKLAEMPENTRLVEDLGIDSLTMLEVVLSIEEALSIRIENEDLMNIRTLAEVKTFVQNKSSGEQSKEKIQTASRQIFGREEIMVNLPQQPPFLFLDKAEIEGDIVRAAYQVTGDEYFLEGHFKGDPVFPASIVFEAMGQAACLWVLTQAERIMGKPLDQKHVLFASMESAHFYRKARPGDLLKFEISLKKLREPMAVFSCKGSVGSEKLALVEDLVIIFGEATALESPNSQSDTSLPQL